MQEDKAQLSERARALLLSFAISHNASDFCRFITVVAFREFGAKSSMLIRVEADSSLRTVGNYGTTRPDESGPMRSTAQVRALKQSITHNRIIEMSDVKDESGRSDTFIAIPFNPRGSVLGALGLTFRGNLNLSEIPEAEIELLRLLSELISVNSIPRMRAEGLLSKLYFDELEKDSVGSITHRQLRVLDEIALGKTNAQIAKELNVSESTIKQESVKIFRILGVSSRQRAVSVAKELGLI